jgi:predicted DNA-binding transcriptional regulator AlpA
MILTDLIRAISEIDPGDMPAILAACASRLAESKPAPSPADDELLDAAAAARALGVSKSTLYHGEFPFTVKVGGSRRYSRNGIKKYIEGRQRKA